MKKLILLLIAIISTVAGTGGVTVKNQEFKQYYE